MSFSPTRLRRRSFLNDPPGYSPNLPGHSILLNCTERSPSPNPSSSTSSHTQGHSHAEADAIAAKAALGTVSFAPLPVIPPELKRRSSITLGVAARKNLLSSPEDEIYPDPKKKAAAAAAAAAAGDSSGGAPRGNGAIRSVYMNDQDWEEYKRQHAARNGNEVVDIGELVTNQAKNLWRKVKPSPTQQKAELGPDASPTTSTSSGGGMFSSLTSPKMGSSPGSSNGILGSFSAPRLSIRRRSDPGTPSNVTPKESATKSPELPKVEEESLSRRESAEPNPIPSSPTSPKYMDWEQKPRSASINSNGVQLPSVPIPPSTKSPHGPPSPPPLVQDVLPSEDEVKDRLENDDRGNERELLSDDDFHDAEDEVGTLGLEKVEIQSEAGHGQPEQRQYRSGGRDSAVLGFDRSRFGGE